VAARNGKIAQCPEAVKRELNRRLDDGELSPQILPWINGLPEVKAMLAERWEGSEISPQNLTEWRQGGYQDHLEQKELVEKTKSMAEFSLRLAKAAGGDLTEGAVAIRAGQIMAELENTPPEERESLTAQITSLRGKEIDAKKIKQTDKKQELDERRLDLDEKRFQVQAATLFIEYVHDVKAREIAEGKASHDVKVQQLIPILFGHRPKKVA
jgi:hypothetical protein